MQGAATSRLIGSDWKFVRITVFVGCLAKQCNEALDGQAPLTRLADQLVGAGEEGLLFHLDRGCGSPMDTKRAGAVLLQNLVIKQEANGGEHFIRGHVAGTGQFGRLQERIAGLQVTLDEGGNHRTYQLIGPGGHSRVWIEFGSGTAGRTVRNLGVVGQRLWERRVHGGLSVLRC